MTDSEIIKKTIISLKDSRLVHNQADFCKQISYSRALISQIVTGRNNLSEQIIHSILKTFPMVNKEFLLTGEGEVLIIEKTPVISRGNIRYWVDIDATGGGLISFDYTSEHRVIDINIPEFRDCTDAINLYGDSMSPRYKPGQIIILKEWTERFIEYGNVYLIITKMGNRMVKQLKKTENDTLLCVSFNPDFDPFTIEKEDIIKLFIVKGAIEKSVI